MKYCEKISEGLSVTNNWAKCNTEAMQGNAHPFFEILLAQHFATEVERGNPRLDTRGGVDIDGVKYHTYCTTDKHGDFARVPPAAQQTSKRTPPISERRKAPSTSNATQYGTTATRRGTQATTDPALTVGAFLVRIQTLRCVGHDAAQKSANLR